jgi:hypothetical protein
MNTDDVDRILARDTEIVPSKLLVQHVMAAVRREAAIPPPIGFPWHRALPGIVGASVILVAAVWGLTVAAATPEFLTPIRVSATALTWLAPCAWSVVGCLVGWAAVRASALMCKRW